MDRGHILAILHQIQRWSELSCPAVSNIAGGSWDTPVFVGLRDRWPWGFFGHAALEDQRAVWGCSEGRKNSAETNMEVEEKSPKDEDPNLTRYNSSNACFNHIEMPRRCCFCAWTIGCWSWFHAKSTSGAVNLYHFSGIWSFSVLV